MQGIGRIALLAAGVTLTLSAQDTLAQGCVAAHANQRSFDQLVGKNTGGEVSSNWYHNVTVDIGYRVFNSNKYFVGDKQIYRPTAVENHQNIFDIGLEYQLSHRWSLIADVPVFDGTRNQIYPPKGVFQVSGIGDVTVGAQSWLFRPPTENGGNVAVNAQVKLPTGINNATGSALYQGKIVKATADQSMQPGDGTWAFSVGTQGYKRLWHSASLYGQGNYLFSPVDTTSVKTFRSQPGQGVMSATDQYLYRGGISQSVPKIRGLALSAGLRGEGVPVRDLLGDSNGFRRPGTIVSFDPGLMYTYKHDTLSVSGPWALYRNRPPSATEIKYGTKNGDAFFADYTVLVNVSHHF